MARRGLLVVSTLLLLWVTPPLAAANDDEADLVAAINARRAEPRDCAGAARPAVPPLAASALLVRVDAADAAGDLGKALAAVGYRAAQAAAIVVGGVRDAAGAADVVIERNCAAVVDARFAEIGVARRGDTWRVNLARPLLAADLGDWRVAGQAVLALVNEARRKPRSCGQRRLAASPPLTWNETLAATALAHSRDMAKNDYFDHADRRGATVTERADRHGYRWHAIGENIAAGVGSAERVVAGWLASPTHCANVMSADFAEMGAAYAVGPNSAMQIYWTQVFGRP